jgi:GMP synthase (glutamine-hydrolysing)
LARAFETRFDAELVSPLSGFGNPGSWLERSRADALVLSGSDRSVLSELSWMLEEEAVLRYAVERGVPALAVCFGHQLLAKALGADIATREKRIGLFELERARRSDGDPEHGGDLFDGVGDPIVVPEQHSDQVVDVPPGFELVATSGYCRVQAVRHSAHAIFGVQFHPCYDDDVFEADEEWRELGFDGPFEHDGARILGNAVRLMADALAS